MHLLLVGEAIPGELDLVALCRGGDAAVLPRFQVGRHVRLEAVLVQVVERARTEVLISLLHLAMSCRAFPAYWPVEWTRGRV